MAIRIILPGNYCRLRFDFDVRMRNTPWSFSTSAKIKRQKSTCSLQLDSTISYKAKSRASKSLTRPPGGTQQESLRLVRLRYLQPRNLMKSSTSWSLMNSQTWLSFSLNVSSISPSFKRSMNSLKFVFRIPKQPRTPFCEVPEHRALPWCRVVMGSTADQGKLFFLARQYLAVKLKGECNFILKKKHIKIHQYHRHDVYF